MEPGGCRLRLDPRDGTDVVTAAAQSLRVGEGSDSRTLRRVRRGPRGEATLVVTDARLAVSGVAPRTTRRSARTGAGARSGDDVVFAGHVWFPWLGAVGHLERSAWRGRDQLRVVTYVREGRDARVLSLDVVLAGSGSGSAGELARTIVRRAARHRLAHTRIGSPEARREIEALLDPPPLPAARRAFAFYTFPTYYFAHPDTAHGNVGSGRGCP